jgi:predicted acetylornithine/succinylornithine family transaminase
MENPNFQSKKIMDLTDRHIMHTYARQPIVLARGEGSYVWDLTDKKYLDFLSGISVMNLGHRVPQVIKKIEEQMSQIFHCSNIYYTVPAALLAEMLTARTFADQVFFCNSGAEANEAAIKLARAYASKNRGPECREIISMHRSFHGRTMATLSATGQEKVRKGFEPFLPGFHFVNFGDLESLKAKITSHTAAILLEPIQGEGGIYIPPKGYLSQVRQLCSSEGIVLIFDEIQVGMGRTGKFCAHEWEGMTPDIMTLAKALGGGLPLGACLATEQVAKAFEPGMHASTFGANPISCAAGQAMVEAIGSDELLSNCVARGEQLQQGLMDLSKKYDVIGEIRGRGLIWGMELDFEAKSFIKTCLEQGLLVNLAGAHVVRMLPPLNVQESQVEEALGILDSVFQDL